MNAPSLVGPAETGSATLAQAQEFALLLTRAGLETQAIEDPRGVKWAKLIFNASANMVCALTRQPFYSMYKQPGLQALVHGLAREGMAVAQALGITLAFDPIDKFDTLYEEGTDHVPSTLTEILNGQRTEIDALNAALVARAESIGVECPLNKAVTLLIRGLESA